MKSPYFFPIGTLITGVAFLTMLAACGEKHPPADGVEVFRTKFLAVCQKSSNNNDHACKCAADHLLNQLSEEEKSSLKTKKMPNSLKKKLSTLTEEAIKSCAKKK